MSQLPGIVLLAESSPSVRDLLRGMLYNGGVKTVVMCADVETAKARLNGSEPKLALIDWDLTGGGGEALLRHIRFAVQGTKSLIPVIVTLAKPTPADIVAALRAGAHEVVSRPFAANALYARMIASMRPDRSFIRTKNYAGPVPRTPEHRKLLGLDGEDAAKPAAPPAKPGEELFYL